MNLIALSKPIALFLVLNAIFGVYLFSVDVVSAILLLGISIATFGVYIYTNVSKFISVSRIPVNKDIFEKIIALIPFNIKFMDLDNNVLISNNRTVSADCGTILDKFDFNNSKIMRVKIDKRIYHFFVCNGAVFDDKKNVVAHLQVELVMNDILHHINKYDMKEWSDNKRAIVAFNNLNDALGIYESNSANIDATNNEEFGESAKFSEIDTSNGGKYFIINHRFETMLDFVEMPGDNYILDLFHPSERMRVEAILNGLGSEGILFESLMINHSGTFPVEINANIISVGTSNLINLSIRDITLRKINEKKRDRARLLKIKHNEILQQIHILRLTTDKINEIINAVQNTIEDIIAQHNEMQDELNEILRLQGQIIASINETIAFYSRIDMKTMVNIVELIECIKSVIFTKSILNNNTISIIRHGEVGDIYCDKNALQTVLLTIIRNSLEHINYAKGNNFYGKIIVEIEWLNDEKLLISIEDNGGGINDDSLERCFDAFYSTHTHKAGLGLAVCKVMVEDLLSGEIMAMNTGNGFRIEITLPLSVA